MSNKNSSSRLAPIVLYDHLPGILAGYPAILFAILAVVSWIPSTVINEEYAQKLEEARVKIVEEMGLETDVVADLVSKSDYQWLNTTQPMFNSHMLFWIGLSVMLIWYIAFRFNMPKNKFLLMFFMFGFLVGLPVVLELTTENFRLFTITSSLLGQLEPSVNTGAWIVMSLVFTIIWLGNFIYSRTHMKVVIDESGLTVSRLGGKGERFELIGLKTENEPLDYLEMFLAGVGSLSLKTRMNKPIFAMKRVIGLYWLPWLPFAKGKLARIEEMLSYQGKVISVDKSDAAEMADASGDDDADGELHDGDSDGHDLDDAISDQASDFDGSSSETSSPDERGID